MGVEALDSDMVQRPLARSTCEPKLDGAGLRRPGRKKLRFRTPRVTFLEGPAGQLVGAVMVRHRDGREARLEILIQSGRSQLGFERFPVAIHVRDLAHSG